MNSKIGNEVQKLEKIIMKKKEGKEADGYDDGEESGEDSGNKRLK